MSEKISLLNLSPSPAKGLAIDNNLDLTRKKARGATLSKTDLAGNSLSSVINSGKIYTKRASGYFQRLRRSISYLLLTLFFVMPWLEIAGKPAVLFDLAAQKFHILGMTFWPQDAIFLVYLLVLSCILLVAATLIIGRVWCGFSCPQTIWTFLFIWVENKCEGDRNQRIKLDKQRWSHAKVLRKSIKHSLWILLSLATAYSFVGYFYPIKALLIDTYNMQVHYLGVFWLIFFVLGTYINAGWLREQVCLHMCPYARFQAVMYSEDTLVVTYDSQRGEHRGHRKASTDLKATGLGDCVDCSLCVQVCPVDIDIRDGMQYPCIDCGLCIDVCDTVMDKMGYASGLIRFSSANDPAGKRSLFSLPKIHWLIALSLSAILAFGYSLQARDTLSIDVIRDRSGILYRHRDGGIENTYQVKINNKGSELESFRLGIIAEAPFQLRGNHNIYVEIGKVDTLIVRVWIAQQDINQYQSDIRFVVRPANQTSGDEAPIAEQISSFIAPVNKLNK